MMALAAHAASPFLIEGMWVSIRMTVSLGICTLPSGLKEGTWGTENFQVPGSFLHQVSSYLWTTDPPTDI